MNPPPPIPGKPKKPLIKQAWRWAIVLPVLTLLIQYLAVAPVGTSAFLIFIGFGAILALPSMLATIALPFLMIRKKHRKTALHWWLVCVVFTGLLFASLLTGRKIRDSAFDSLAERSTPLVTAIADYTAQHGSPPESLQALVPQYLEEVPRTGIMAYPEYKYEVAPEAERYLGNPWVLHIPCTSGGLNWDEFVYLPLQNYGDEMSSNYYRRVRDWGYLHE